MKKQLQFAGLMLSLLSWPAQADVTGWTGCHAGLNAGYGRGHNQITQLLPPVHDAGSTRSDGAIGGIQLGCDLQHGRLVLGVQGLADLADLDGDHVYRHGTGPNDRVRYQTGSLATLTGRAGLLLSETLLVYARVGWSWARDRYRDQDPAPASPSELPYLDKADATRNGWTAGFGVEQAWSGNLSLFAEYNHLAFGKQHITLTEVAGSQVGTAFPYTIDQDIDAIMVGLNYRF